MEPTLSNLWRQLARKHRSSVQSYLDTLGLYIGQPRFLFELENHPGMTQKGLSEALQVTKETVSIAVTRLEASGFITREVNQVDRRCRQIYLTDKGHETVIELHKNFDRINNSMFRLLNDQERKQLELLFSAMIKGLEG